MSKDLKALIGCEESQTVCKAFRALGIEAYSNDLKACSGGFPEWHLQMDVFEAIDLIDWDFIGLHPVCTKMTLSGNRTYGVGKPRHQERLDAVEWTIKLWKYACSKAKYVYMENPMGAMNGDRRLPKPQVVQPYYFGDQYQKTTCLWLQGLPYLYHNDKPNLFDQNVTHVDRGEMFVYINKKGQKKSQPKWYADALSLPAYERSEVRSKTFPGIGNAMANQWTEFMMDRK